MKKVNKNIGKARSNFSHKQTVKQRETHIDLPVSINNQIVDQLSANDLKTYCKRDICWFLIQGEGGAGKTHLACQIAKWCLDKEKELNIFDHPAIPIIIEDDLSSSKNEQEPLIKAIGGQLRLIIEAPDKILNDLLIELLTKKRVVVIVDHLSEMSDFTRSEININSSDSCVNAMIVTSRINEKLSGRTPLLLNPQRIKKGHLRHFVDAYLRKLDRFDLFKDLEFGEVLDNLSKIVGDRDVTVLMCKLYADQLIAYKKGEMVDLPQNVPDLMLQYLNELNRNVKDGRIPDNEVHTYVKMIAWLSLEQNFISSYVSIEIILKRLGENNSQEKLKYLIDKIRILNVAKPTQNKVRFILDPLAEYLAGLYIVENFNAKEWEKLLSDLRSLKDNLSISGFVYALIDCCNTTLSENKIPSDFIKALNELTPSLAMFQETVLDQ